ncbi:MAG: sigma-70 family RNA polymerase sigma factor [Pseudomonadota bacterium]|nr:sigma-70 family RNA polymerase sigma factor [Pseudomonadota bacterium]
MNAQANFNSAGLTLVHDDLAPPHYVLITPPDLTRIKRDAADKAFADDLTAVIPALRAFAISMVRHLDRADDLVQDTLLKAWANRHRYEEGTNFRSWMFVILRNTLFSQYRKSKREVEDVDGKMAATLISPASQDGHMDLEDFKIALAKLPSKQREALILTGGSGFSYEETAEICGCLVGTVKSRVSRARTALAGLLGLVSVPSPSRPICVKSPH